MANVRAPARREYHGQEYWGEELEKRLFGLGDGNPARLIPLPPLYDVFDVSPDGRWLAMHWDTHSSLTGAQLYVARADGSDLRPVARKRSQYYWYPRFSPDGKTLLAKHLDARGGRVTMRVIALDGSWERSISLQDGWEPEEACWSPDGRFIAVAAYVDADKHGKLLVLNSAGTHVHEIELADSEQVRISGIDWTAARLVSH
jgi:Tol biopolymer transport system component